MLRQSALSITVWGAEPCVNWYHRNRNSCCVYYPSRSGTGNRASSSYSVDSNGILSVSCAPVTTSEEILFTNETYTKTKVLIHTQSGDVVAYLQRTGKSQSSDLTYPCREKPAGHEERMVRYTAAGYAFLFVDIRGNGGQTPGDPFNPQRDFSQFEKGDWPQYYLTVCDLVAVGV